ncbi:MAG: TetR/AcrR family transcriptional regulator, partial [Eubacteriaceae bacterium]
KAAVSLFDKHGFENTSIEDICIKAGLSVGAFYYYYSSKSDIYCELHSKIDEYYKKNVQDKLNSEDFYDNIILYFKHYADFINMKGFDDVKQLFNKNKFF